MAVATGKAKRYDELLCKAASIFIDNGWRLLISAEALSRFETSGPVPGLQRELLHLWSIPSFDTITDVMAAAADNSDYVEAQGYTINEAQNLYMTLLWDNPIGLPDMRPNFYMMETLQVRNGIDLRWPLAKYMRSAVYRMGSADRKSRRWRILFAGNASTGLIDQYVHIWGLEDLDCLEESIKEYRDQKAWIDAVESVSTSMWIPRKIGGENGLDCFATLAGAQMRPTTAGAQAG
jgi:hypothetical protein